MISSTSHPRANCTTMGRSTPIVRVPTGSLTCRLHRLVTSAQPPLKSIQPEETGPTEWDPEGLLPPPPSGGHFARRGELSDAAEQPAAAAAPPAAPVCDLLAPRKRKTPVIGASAPLTAPSPPVTPPQRAFGEVPAAPETSLSGKIEAAFLETFWGASAAPRVLDSFRRLCLGEEFVKVWPGLGVQRAGSYVAGLSAVPFPDVHSGAYPWLEEVERQAAVIQEEFKAAMAAPESLQSKGNRVWVAAAREDAVEYGPNWRTLVLQDRGIWETTNSALFPRTTQILKDLNAPTLEVFFARQDGGTGIKSHTDNANFVQTSHLGIDVPEGECWIKVGDFTHEWANGKVVVMDTSFMHETQNNSTKDRYVLIMRHWHPEMTPLERIATAFLFAASDDPTPAGIKAAQKEAVKRLKAIATVGAGKKKGKGGSAGGGFGGFGKKA